jgi:plasmid stability protein
MSTLTIRNVAPDLKARLRQAAATHGRSMEEEVRVILRRVLAQPDSSAGLGSRIRARFALEDRIDLPLPERSAVARGATFEPEPTP